MSYEPRIVVQEEQLVLSVRTRTSVGNLPGLMGKTYGAIAAYLGELGEQPSGMPFAGYFNMDMQNLDVEIGIPVRGRLPGRGDIRLSKIPGGQLATCIHAGPYSAIEPAYIALQQFVKDGGYEATGAAYEIYLNDPGETPEEELKTQIIFPLRED